MLLWQGIESGNGALRTVSELKRGGQYVRLNVEGECGHCSEGGVMSGFMPGRSILVGSAVCRRMGVLPGCDDGLFEGLELLKETLIRQYPSMFRLREEHTIENLVTGDVWDLRRDASTWEKHHPLEVMSLLATEFFFYSV